MMQAKAFYIFTYAQYSEQYKMFQCMSNILNVLKGSKIKILFSDLSRLMWMQFKV